MISKMYFYSHPIYRKKVFNKLETDLYLKFLARHSLSPSLVFKGKSIKQDRKLRKSKSTLLNYKKLERELFKVVFEMLKGFDPVYKKSDCGKIEILQFAKYNKGDFFDWHKDSYPNRKKSLNRIFTIILILSDRSEYRGGNLELLDYNNNLIKLSNLQKGEIIIFPSELFHRISPILSGERMSLTSWLIGKNMTGMSPLE